MWHAPDATYATMRDSYEGAAYASFCAVVVDKSMAKIPAHALEVHRPDIVAIEPEIVAHHYIEAGDTNTP